MRNLKTLLLWLAIVVVAGGLSLFQKSDAPRPVPADTPVVVATVAEAPAAPTSQSPSEELRGTRGTARNSEKWPRVHQLITDATEREQLLKTLDLIARGGPFPYPRKDGTVFGNRERRLPSKPRGYYREYTVPTPGASNRGARRVVQGKGGETYYTSDHYETFARLDQEEP